MKKLMMQGLLSAAIALGASGAALAGDQDGCTLKTLHGRYVFAASGFTIVLGVPQLKAIVEIIDFDGDGEVAVPKVTLNVNGSIVRLSPGASGRFTLDEACTGTIAFVSGTALTLSRRPKATKSG